MIFRYSLVAAILFFGLKVNGQPTKHLYLGNDTHTDLIWNGMEDDWYKWNLDMAKFYLKLGEETAGNPPETRSKWNYDVAWTLYMMEKREPKEFFDRIVKQIQNGQASVPLNFTLPVYGGSTTESVLRSFYLAGRLERKYGIDIDMAICQENATQPLGLASLWAGSGAKYSWKGVCNCATKIKTVGPRDREIYWQTGLDSSKILLKWYSNSGWNAELGGYAEMLEPTVAVQQMDKLCGSPNYPYNIAAAFGKGWDNIHNYTLDLQWGVGHRTLPGTKLYLSNQLDFFKHFEKEYGKVLPCITASYGNEWELGMASLAAVSGKLRRSMEKLRTAEAMAALVSLYNHTPFNSLQPLKEAFLYGISMYNLHGWTADGPVGRNTFANFMRNRQQDVSNYTDQLFQLSLKELGHLIHSDGKKDMVFVFNPLNWERKGMVDIPVSQSFNSVKDLSTGKVYQGNLIETSQGTVLRVWIEGIPSTGYTLFELTNTTTDTGKIPFKLSGNKLETPYYTVLFDRSGAITSLYDKKLKKEWAKGKLNDIGVKDKKNGKPITIADRGANQVTLKFQSDLPVKHETLITFYSQNNRIDFDNHILQNFDTTLHYTFDFNITDPTVWHEEVGAVIKAKTIANGGHYADRMARYDYLSLNHFLTMGNANESITLSNIDCQFFKLGNSTPTRLDAESASIHILAGGVINENLGVPKQGGDTVFRESFALFPSGEIYNETTSMKRSLEHQNPLTAGQVYKGGLLTEKTLSLLSIDNPDILLWSIKPSETEGISLRLWNLSDKSVPANILFQTRTQKAFNSTHIETDIEEITLRGNNLPTDFRQKQLKTFRVVFDTSKLLLMR